jgi:hypothetical protein
MPHPRFNDEEICQRGQEIYERKIRARVEIPENLGKLVSVDVETEDFEIGDDASIDAPLRLHAKHPGAAIYTLRIGYNAAVSLGGVLEQTSAQRVQPLQQLHQFFHAAQHQLG